MGKRWMGFHDPILQAQKSHPGPQRGSLLQGLPAWRCQPALQPQLAFPGVPRVLPQGEEAEPTSHLQLQEPHGAQPVLGPSKERRELKMG